MSGKRTPSNILIHEFSHVKLKNAHVVMSVLGVKGHTGDAIRGPQNGPYRSIQPKERSLKGCFDEFGSY